MFHQMIQVILPCVIRRCSNNRLLLFQDNTYYFLQLIHLNAPATEDYGGQI